MKTDVAVNAFNIDFNKTITQTTNNLFNVLNMLMAVKRWYGEMIAWCPL